MAAFSGERQEGCVPEWPQAEVLFSFNSSQICVYDVIKWLVSCSNICFFLRDSVRPPISSELHQRKERESKNMVMM